LIRRIYEYALERGYLREGDTVLDPFAGVALGGLDAMFHGLHFIGCELEDKFVQLGQQNIDLWNLRYGNGKLPRWGTAVIVQGDSRDLARVLDGARAEGIVASPPFQESIGNAANAPDRKIVRPFLPKPKEVADYLQEKRLEKGLTRKEIDDYLGTVTLYSWYEGRPAGIQIPTPKHWRKLKELLELDNRFDKGILTEVEVEAIGKHTTGKTGHSNRAI